MRVIGMPMVLRRLTAVQRHQSPRLGIVAALAPVGVLRLAAAVGTIGRGWPYVIQHPGVGADGFGDCQLLHTDLRRCTRGSWHILEV